GDDAELVSVPRAEMTDSQRDAFGYVRLAPVGRAEPHGRRDVEHQPGYEHALREVKAHVGLAGPGRDVPVDSTHVVAGNVRTHLGQLGPRPVLRRPVIAGQETLA